MVLAAGTYGVISANSPDSTRELVASVDLDPLKDTGNGTAELVVVDGVEQLRITADGLPPAPSGHHYEMWLIDTEVTNPQSLGELPSGQDTASSTCPRASTPMSSRSSTSTSRSTARCSTPVSRPASCGAPWPDPGAM